MPPKRAAKRKPQAGKGIISTITGVVNKGVAAVRNVGRKVVSNGRSRPLLPGEHHFPLMNFEGPGTRYDLKEVRDFKPFNSIDECSRIHDDDYWNARNLVGEAKARAIQEADRKVLACYNKHKGTYGYAAGVAGIGGKVIAEKAYSAIKGKPSVLYGGRKKKAGVKKPKMPRRNKAGQFVKA
jgi:hypothetical protein